MTHAPTVTVRRATREDLPAIAEIAAHYVLHTVTTFQTEPLTLAGWEERWESLRAAGRPFLVVTVAEGPGLPDDVAGFAYVGAWRERPAYAATGEDTIYLAPGSEGRGLGRALLSRLLDEAREAGVREVVAVVSDAESPASVVLHEKLDFRQVGRLERVGFKHGRWLDTVLLQRSLG
ncbi:GNAT family N-acetyltransferase [Oerskovia merdavium]|uniref:N-acetyltransferase n=1 Tax=Oerskovia merdavium TaxID=2762227 RepID=A0ABR8U3K5_9CELL|nr:GNAT family N-acetyltransferase [Oerskovia merdavium]MBD7982623.1 N-acetyltransferase [Oerskovia merdavium]